MVTQLIQSNNKSELEKRKYFQPPYMTGNNLVHIAGHALNKITDMEKD